MQDVEARNEELKRAGLIGDRELSRLLTHLRAEPETHLSLADVVRIAAEAGLAATPASLGRQLQRLADHGLLGRLPTSTAEQIFDTVPEPHAHLVYEDKRTSYVDLHVSSETLISIIRHALVERPNEVDVVIRFRTPQQLAAARRRVA
jgi:Fe2+ or Zn2+ uptake regulation protein